MRAPIVVVAIALGLAPSSARAESEAERLYNEGQQAYDAHRYDAAVTAWERSYALSKLPALLFNIAQAQRLRGKPGDCTRATANYRKFIALQPRSTERPTAEGFLAELAPCVEAEAEAAAASPSAEPSSRGAAPTRSATTAESATAIAPTGTITAERSAGSQPGRGKRVAGYAVGGAGVALVLTGVYFGAKARRLGGEVTDECRDGCDWNLVEDKDAEGKRAETTQYVMYGIGLGALAAGGVLWWLGTKERDAAPTVTVDASGGGGAVVRWSGTW